MAKPLVATSNMVLQGVSFSEYPSHLCIWCIRGMATSPLINLLPFLISLRHKPVTNSLTPSVPSLLSSDLTFNLHLRRHQAPSRAQLGNARQGNGRRNKGYIRSRSLLAREVSGNAEKNHITNDRSPSKAPWVARKVRLV